jgi:hypothetical protein
MFDKVYDELRAVPVTLMLVCGLYIAVTWLYWDHIPSREFYVLQSQLQGVQETLKRDHIDSRVHAVEAEIFNLTQHVNEARAKNLPVDNLYFERLNDLNNQQEELKSELHILNRTSIERQPP